MHRTTTGKRNRLLVAMMAALLTFALLPSVPASAVGGASFNGEGATRVWEYDSVNVTAYGFDLFGAATRGLVPGDTRSVAVALRNNAPDPVDFRLAARSLSTAETRYLEAIYPGKTADDSLLDAIDVRVRHGATTLYSGTLRGMSSSELYSSAGVAVGRVSASWVGSITVDLTLRANAGNALGDRLCAVEWVFIAAQYNDDDPTEPPIDPEQPTEPERPAAPVSGGGGGGSTVVVIDNRPASDLPDAQAPASPNTTDGDQADVVIEADPVPETQGASAWALLNLILTGVSAVLMLALMLRFLLSRRRRDEGSDHGVSDAQLRFLPEFDVVSQANRLEQQRAREAARAERHDRHVRLKALFWLFGICALIISVLLFILTQDMSLPMQWVDRYTIGHVLIVLIQALILIFPRTPRPHLGTVK
jgi:hypothetical protein